MLGRWRALPALLLVLALAALVGLTITPAPASAAVPGLPPLPPGALDWYDALFDSKSLSEADRRLVLKQLRAGYTGTSTAFQAIPEAESIYARGRLARAAAAMRMTPKTSLVVGTGVPLTLGALAAGYIAYKIIENYTDENGNPATQNYHLVFETHRVGYSTITLPSSSFFALGQDYIFEPYGHATAATDWGGAKAFGWMKRDRGVNGVYFVFNYQMMTAHAGAGQTYPTYSAVAAPTEQISPYAGRLPTYEQCIGIITQCLGVRTAGEKAGLAGALLDAGNRTMDGLKGNVTPLVVELSNDSQAAGQIMDGLSCTTGSPVGVKCRTAYVTVEEFDTNTPVKRQAASPGTIKDTTTHNAPADAGTTNADADAGKDRLNDPCARAIFNHAIDPDNYAYEGCAVKPPAGSPDGTPTPIPPAPTPTSPFVPFLLPEPLSWETYAQYIARLRELGWVGTASVLAETDGYPADSAAAFATAGTPTRVKVGTGAPVPLYWPGVVPAPGTTWWPGTTSPFYPGAVPSPYTPGVRIPWPINPPQVSTSTTTITIMRTPLTTEPAYVPPVGTPPPGGGGCDPWIDVEPDFSPLTSLSLGNKFPFGLFAWATAAIGWFNVAANAPIFDFDLGAVDTPVGDFDLGSYTVDLSWWDSYMATFRLLLSFALWVGTVWYLATSLLGFRAGGDPSDAVDDVL